MITAKPSDIEHVRSDEVRPYLSNEEPRLERGKGTLRAYETSGNLQALEAADHQLDEPDIAIKEKASYCSSEESSCFTKIDSYRRQSRRKEEDDTSKSRFAEDSFEVVTDVPESREEIDFSPPSPVVLQAGDASLAQEKYDTAATERFCHEGIGSDESISEEWGSWETIIARHMSLENLSERPQLENGDDFRDSESSNAGCDTVPTNAMRARTAVHSSSTSPICCSSPKELHRPHSSLIVANTGTYSGKEPFICVGKHTETRRDIDQSLVNTPKNVAHLRASRFKAVSLQDQVIQRQTLEHAGSVDIHDQTPAFMKSSFALARPPWRLLSREELNLVWREYRQMRSRGTGNFPHGTEQCNVRPVQPGAIEQAINGAQCATRQKPDDENETDSNISQSRGSSLEDGIYHDGLAHAVPVNNDNIATALTTPCGKALLNSMHHDIHQLTTQATSKSLPESPTQRKRVKIPGKQRLSESYVFGKVVHHEMGKNGQKAVNDVVKMDAKYLVCAENGNEFEQHNADSQKLDKDGPTPKEHRIAEDAGSSNGACAAHSRQAQTKQSHYLLPDKAREDALQSECRNGRERLQLRTLQNDVHQSRTVEKDVHQLRTVEKDVHQLRTVEKDVHQLRTNCQLQHKTVLQWQHLTLSRQQDLERVKLSFDRRRLDLARSHETAQERLRQLYRSKFTIMVQLFYLHVRLALPEDFASGVEEMALLFAQGLKREVRIQLLEDLQRLELRHQEKLRSLRHEQAVQQGERGRVWRDLKQRNEIDLQELSDSLRYR